MFKPRKEEAANPAATGKISLPVQAGMPKSSVIKTQMEEADKRRGATVEQSWTTSKPNQLFLLMCKWEAGAKNPVWTLYEENPDESKMHFSEAFESADFAMMYDVICMTVPADGSSSAVIPDTLKPSEKSNRGGPGGGASDAPKPTSPSPSSFPPPAQFGGASMPGPMGGAMGNQGGGGAGYPPPQQPAPYPNYQQQQPYPQQPHQPQPPYPQQAPQQYQQPQHQQQQQYAQPPQQSSYTNTNNQQSPWQQGYAPPPQQTPYVTSHPSQSGTFSAQINPGFDSEALNTKYSDLMHKQANILLGTLLFESELINQNTLDAALKVQEYVRESQMTPAQACDVLKRHHMMGASIDQYLTPDDFDMKKSAPPRSATAGATSAAPAKPTASSEKAQLQHAAFDILQKSGLLKEEDLKTATAVVKKHGGDMPSILQAAGKLDGTTYKAAETCIPLIKKGAMKVEQCIIALNYCNRSRVDFDAALDELGWENPRKAAT